MAHYRMLTVFGFFALTSCSMTAPRDLKLKSVQLSYLDRDLFDGIHAHEVSKPSGAEQNLTEVLKVSFYSKTNLFEVRRDNGYNIGGEASSCKPINGGLIDIPIGYVYWRGYSVNTKFEDIPLSERSSPELAAGQVISYEVYALVRRDASVAARTQKPTYDLQRAPFDLCLRVHGGNMMGMEFTSNVVQVPQDQISSALRK